MNTARLAVSAAFARGLPGYRTTPAAQAGAGPGDRLSRQPARLARRAAPAGAARRVRRHDDGPRAETRARSPATRASGGSSAPRRAWTATCGRWTSSAATLGKLSRQVPPRRRLAAPPALRLLRRGRRPAPRRARQEIPEQRTIRAIARSRGVSGKVLTFESSAVNPSRGEPCCDRRTFLGTAGAVLLTSPLRLLAQNNRIQTVGLQLYTVRDEMAKDFEGTLAKVAAIGYKEVEFAGYFNKTPKDVRAVLDRHGLTSPADARGLQEPSREPAAGARNGRHHRPPLHRPPLARRRDAEGAGYLEACGRHAERRGRGRQQVCDPGRVPQSPFRVRAGRRQAALRHPARDVRPRREDGAGSVLDHGSRERIPWSISGAIPGASPWCT